MKQVEPHNHLQRKRCDCGNAVALKVGNAYICERCARLDAGGYRRDTEGQHVRRVSVAYVFPWPSFARQ